MVVSTRSMPEERPVSMYPYVEEVKLVDLAANAVGEEKHISLEPRHRLGRILEADAGTAHDDWIMMLMKS